MGGRVPPYLKVKGKNLVIFCKFFRFLSEKINSFYQNTDWAKPFESLLQVASCSSDSNGMAWSV